MNEKEIIEYIKIKLEYIIPEYTETLVDGKPYRIENLQLETNWTKRTAEKVQGLLDLYNNLKEIEEEHRKENGELRVELEKEKEMYKNTGKIVKNKRDGKVGVVLREFETGQIQVLEKIGDKGGKVINTHDSWKTLELLEE
jgi:hypothetical protein